MKRTICVAVVVATVCLAWQLGAQGATPATGRDVIARMRSQYAGQWFRTLTFRQTTTIAQRSGTDTVQTWYETLRVTPEHGAELRIDVAPLSNGNATISRWDSTWVLRADTLSTVRATGNPFVALIAGAYDQSVERSLAQLAPLGVDLTKLRSAQWKEHAVWIIGSSDPADTTSAQFWVESKHLVVVRVILAGSANRPPTDVHLDAIQPCGKGWLATRVEMLSGGRRRQLEEYHDWKCDGPVDALLFNPWAGKSATHWAR
jgi:hypothetical protein